MTTRSPFLVWYHRHVTALLGERVVTVSTSYTGWQEDRAVAIVLVLCAVAGIVAALLRHRGRAVGAALFLLGLGALIFAGYRVGTLPANGPHVSYHRAAGESLAAAATVIITLEALMLVLAPARPSLTVSARRERGSTR